MIKMIFTCTSSLDLSSCAFVSAAALANCIRSFSEVSIFFSSFANSPPWISVKRSLGGPDSPMSWSPPPFSSLKRRVNFEIYDQRFG